MNVLIIVSKRQKKQKNQMQQRQQQYQYNKTPYLSQNTTPKKIKRPPQPLPKPDSQIY